MFERRLRIVAFTGIAFFLLLAIRLFAMQVVDGDRWREEAERLDQSTITLPARRGSILDRHGEPLAEDRLEWNLMVRLDHWNGTNWRCAACGYPRVRASRSPPRRCRECGGREHVPGPERDEAGLAARLGISPAELAARIAGVEAERDRKVASRVAYLRRHYERVREDEVRARYDGWWWVLARDVPPEVLREVSLRPERYRGVGVRAAHRRHRVDDPALRPLLGAVSGVYAEEFHEWKRRGYSTGEIYRMQVGRSGLERALQDRLAARDGYRRVERDSRGRVEEVLEERPARDGETVRTSLDRRLQRIATDELERAVRSGKADGGAFVALDPATGEVIALASYDTKERPHLAVSAVVPGSVFKTVTAIAALETGTLEPGTRFDCRGVWHRIRCHGETHGPIDVAEGLELSCNGFFAWAAGELSIEPLAWWAARLGFGQRTGIELSYEGAGLVPDPQWKSGREDPVWYTGETWQVGFGRGDLMVTPLQVARLMAIVGNGGFDVRPTLVAGESERGERLLTERSLGTVREGLRAVVSSGTARRTGLGEFRAAGKTGTADLPGRGNMAWLAGYAPADSPRVAFACYLNDVEAYGADAAGPVILSVLREALR